MDISKDVMLDNTKPNQDVIHLIIPKNTVIQLADQVNKNGQASTVLMKFDFGTGKWDLCLHPVHRWVDVFRQVMVMEKKILVK